MPFTALPVATPFDPSNPDLLTELCGALEERMQWLGGTSLEDPTVYQADHWSMNPFATYAAEEFPPFDPAPEVGDLWFFGGFTQDLVIRSVVAPSDTPPVSPSGALPYLVGKSATGEWEGHDGQQALWQNTRQVWVFAGSVGLLPTVSGTGNYYRSIDDDWVLLPLGAFATDNHRLYRYNGTIWGQYEDPAQEENGGFVFRVGDGDSVPYVFWSTLDSSGTRAPCYRISLWRSKDLEIIKSVYQMQRQTELLMRWFALPNIQDDGTIDGVAFPVWDPDSLWNDAGVATETSRYVWGFTTFSGSGSVPTNGFVAIVNPGSGGQFAAHVGEIASVDLDSEEWVFDSTTEWVYQHQPLVPGIPRWYQRHESEEEIPPGGEPDPEFEPEITWEEVDIQECGWTRKYWRTIADPEEDEGETDQRAVLWDTGNCLFRPEYFLHDGEQWARAVDQQSPPDIVTSAGTVRPGDLVTAELVNELRAVLVRMTRIMYRGDKLGSEDETYETDEIFGEAFGVSFPEAAITGSQRWFGFTIPTEEEPAETVVFKTQTVSQAWPFTAQNTGEELLNSSVTIIDFGVSGGFEYQ